MESNDIKQYLASFLPYDLQIGFIMLLCQWNCNTRWIGDCKNVFDEAINSLLFPLRDTFICHTGMTNKCLFPLMILFSLFHSFELFGVEKIQHKEFELQFTGATIDINEH